MLNFNTIKEASEYVKNQLKEKRAKTRLAYLRQEIEAERISTSEILELISLKEYIEPGDTLLLQWAEVEEFPEEEDHGPFKTKFNNIKL